MSPADGEPEYAIKSFLRVTNTGQKAITLPYLQASLYLRSRNSFSCLASKAEIFFRHIRFEDLSPFVRW